MSGKAPPRGPRALLNSQSSSQQASSSKLPPTIPAGPKANVVPPTGPRSLMNGGGGLSSRFANGGFNHKVPYVNGHAPSRSLASASKGKGVDLSLSLPSSLSSTQGGVASTSTWANGKRPPTGPSALRSSTASRQQLGQPTSPTAPPPPTPPERGPHPPPPPPLPSDPPPPPPPASPPPLPPSDVPHLTAPIKFPTAQPQEPRLVPPPLPPLPASVPKPPSQAPPPLPPSPQNHLVPKAPISFRLDPRNNRSLPSKPSLLSPPPLPPSVPAPPPPRPPSPPLPDGVISFICNETKLYSVKKPPNYPPPRSEFPEGRDFKVLFDGLCDKDRVSFSSNESLSARSLIELIRHGGVADRIKELNKGKTHIVYRYHGETSKGEPRPVPSDPRKVVGSRRPTRVREEFYTTTYEYDQNTPGPPPPTNVLVIGLPPLTTNAHLRTLFGRYGSMQNFEREIDRTNGAQLGILSIRYSTHEEARKCVAAEDRRFFADSAKAAGLPIMGLNNMTAGKKEDHEEMRVVFDGDGKKLKAVLDEIEVRRKAGKERKKDVSGLNGLIAVEKAGLSGVPAVARPPQGSHSTLWAQQPQLPLKHGIAGLPQRPTAMQGPKAMANDQGAKRLPISMWKARAQAAPRATQLASPTVFNGHPQDPSSSKGAPWVGRGSTESTPIPDVHPALRSRLGPWLARNHPLSQTETPTQESTPHTSRSPSPVSRRFGTSSRLKEERDAAHAVVMKELFKNGYDHIRLEEAQLSGGNVREEDIQAYFGGLKVEKVLHDYYGWYITFTAPGAAARAERVLSLNPRLLANRSVSISVHPAPKFDGTKTARPGSPGQQREEKTWSQEEIVAEAGEMIMKELRALLEKDVTDRVVGMHIHKMAAEERSKRGSEAVLKSAREEGFGVSEYGRTLKGLSFRKRTKKVHIDVLPTPEHEPEPEPEAEPEPEVEQKAEPEAEAVLEKVTIQQSELVAPKEVDMPDEAAQELHQQIDGDISDTEGRPAKRRKSDAHAVFEEQEDELTVAPELPASRGTSPTIVASVPEPATKRPPSPAPSEEHPSKRPRLDVQTPAEEVATTAITEPEHGSTEQLPTPPLHETVPIKKARKKEEKKVEKKSKKKAEKAGKAKKAKAAVLEETEQVFHLQPMLDVPSVVDIPVDSLDPWVPSTPPRIASPVMELKSPGGSRIKPLVESVLKMLASDDEDLYFLKLALSVEGDLNDDYKVTDVIVPPSDPDSPPPFRKHVTGSARTEGYYKISHAEKSAYVAQYALRGSTNEGPAEADPTPQVVVSSRSNRANARRRAQGLEEINQLQLAVALSKGEAGATDVVKFNQLQTRKKHLRFARSPIHDWGLYAMERIARGEMVIEYVGEIVRAAVADKREKAYERQGIGSSYLFRIDEELVADATKKGNLGRLINHSCDPNCTAKIITINGEKKIVIYAKQDIELGDEITYDYHFPIEQDKIPCLCGSAKCRGFLN